MTPKKKVIILGSTGTIGSYTLDIISRYKDIFEVVGLVAKSNIELLERQINIFKPKYVAIEKIEKKEKGRLNTQDSKLFIGKEGISELLEQERVDIVVSAIPGFDGLWPTLLAIKQCQYLALANKEALISAPVIIIDTAKKMNCRILPVDSEHNAIFQILEGNPKKHTISNIWITCSGGACYKVRKLSQVTPNQALAHPTWKMGKKITIDSATLMNKGFEMIEASFLFNIEPDKIKIVIHPECIIHGLVEFIDGFFHAVVSLPDMRLPIAYTLFYPEKPQLDIKKLDLRYLSRLTFEELDFSRFPCVRYSYEVAHLGGSMLTVLASADEVAVEAFLSGKISFDKIPQLIKAALSAHMGSFIKNPTLEEIIEVDRWTKEYLKSLV